MEPSASPPTSTDHPSRALTDPTSEERASASADRVESVLAALRRGERRGPVDLRGARLIGADLSGLDLSGAQLSGVDLSRASLRGARLLKADLTDAILFEADLEDAELAGACLAGANLQGAKLMRAGLGMADLSGASLVDACLKDASLVEAYLAGADLRCADLTGARARAADWSRADLSKAVLYGAELDGGWLRGTCLDSADLRHAHLRGLRDFRLASWVGVDMREIDFTGAYLARRFIHDQNFLVEFRQQSRTSRAAYWLWWLTSDCGRSILRWGLCTGVLVMAFALAYARVGMDWGAYHTSLSPLYTSVVTMTTLGFGDVVPTSVTGQWLVMAQVVTGYVMLGGLLSIFSSKMASRAD